MKSVELNRQYAALRQLIKRSGHDPTTKTLEMQAHWARYICILSAGFVENSVREIYGQYVKKHSYSAAVIKYSVAQLDGVQNPRPERLVKIASAFDPQWGRDLQKYMDDEYLGASINTIMTNRHLIAHGRSSNITVGQISFHLGKAVEISKFMENQCGI